MKCIKKIIVLLMAFVMVTGCQTNPESSKPGTIKEINIDKMVEKFDNEDTFVVMITQTDCGYCKDFHELLDNWLPTHNLTIYEVNLDHEENATPNDNLARIRPYFSNFKYTPSVYYVKDGEFVSDLNPQVQTITESMLNQWIRQNNIL